MQIFKHCLIGLLFANGCVTSISCSETVNLVEPVDEPISIYVGSNDRLIDVIEWAQSYFYSSSEDGEQSYDLVVNASGIMLSTKKVWRDYNQPVTKKEKQDLSYIINSLSQDSLISLAKSKSSLKKTGDRIDHLHPLRFLITVFTSEELKAGVHGIRDRGWVWDEFLSGLTGSLSTESSKNNMKNEYILDFAQRVKIDPNLILPSIQQGQWKNFIHILIDSIPRQNDPNRYNI